MKTARINTDTQQAPSLEPSRVVDRYGEAGKAGWSPVPDVLLFNQKQLGLNSEDMNVLLHLMAQYYVRDTMPFVRPETIAKRMGVSVRSVQRSVRRLRNNGFILKVTEKGRVIHDLEPLIQKLEPFAQKRIADRELRQATQRNVAQTDRAPGSDDHLLRGLWSAGEM